MSIESEVGKTRAPRRLRAGIIIGSAIALIGITVGTATGAVTPFQQVVVVNTPASPIPVAGTVNIGNTPANQNVTVTNPATAPVQVRVTNLPATQPVSGSVSVTNVANRAFTGFANLEVNEAYVYEIPNGINASMIRVTSASFSDDSVAISLRLRGGSVFSLYFGDIGTSGYSNNFTTPVEITGVSVLCLNLLLSCDINVDVLGY